MPIFSHLFFAFIREIAYGFASLRVLYNIFILCLSYIYSIFILYLWYVVSKE